jgi:hypothetical protein
MAFAFGKLADMSNPVTPPFSRTNDDKTLIGQAYATSPTVGDGGASSGGSGPVDTQSLIQFATVQGPHPEVVRMAQELMAWRWANCQANP